MKPKRPPLEQRAYEAFRDCVLSEKPSGDHYGPKAAAFLWEWANFDAERKGLVEQITRPG